MALGGKLIDSQPHACEPIVSWWPGSGIMSISRSSACGWAPADGWWLGWAVLIGSGKGEGGGNLGNRGDLDVCLVHNWCASCTSGARLQGCRTPPQHWRYSTKFTKPVRTNLSPSPEATKLACNLAPPPGFGQTVTKLTRLRANLALGSGSHLRAHCSSSSST